MTTEISQQTEPNLKFIYGFHKDMTGKKLNLVFEGEFTQEITKSVLAMTERNMDSYHEETGVKKKVFNVMVECLQNICKHSGTVKDPDKIGRAVFMVGQEENGYFICTGNYIFSDKVEGLKAKLMEVNSLDKDGLKELYKALIRNGNLADHGGAGLGLIDMARKASSKLEYDFEKVSDTVSFYSLLIHVQRTQE